MNKPQKLQNIILEIFALNAVALGLVIGTASAFAADDNGESWKTPLSLEFSNLDTSGNGLLTPNEASKNHAFSQKSFAKADVDHDGTIDQDEYIYAKSGQWPKDTQTVQNNSVPAPMPTQETTRNGDSPEQMMEKNPTGAGVPKNKLKMDNDLNMQDPSKLDAPDSNAIPSEIPGPEPLNNNQNLPVPDSSNRGSLDNLMAPTVAELDKYTQQVKFQTSESISKDTSGKAIDDNVINTTAIATILDTDDLGDIEISVETHEGEVMLDGFVKNEKDKVKTECVVSMISGVKLVRNYLKVRS